MANQVEYREGQVGNQNGGQDKVNRRIEPTVVFEILF
jgi:hypothetical protein